MTTGKEEKGGNETQLVLDQIKLFIGFLRQSPDESAQRSLSILHGVYVKHTLR